MKRRSSRLFDYTSSKFDPAYRYPASPADTNQIINQITNLNTIHLSVENKRWFCYNKVYNKFADYKVPMAPMAPMAPARNGGRPYGPRTIKLHTEPRTFLVEIQSAVLEEARDKSVPLLERMKFVAIFTSNLDEFFMIRVGSLYDMVQTDDRHDDSRSG